MRRFSVYIVTAAAMVYGALFLFSCASTSSVSEGTVPIASVSDYETELIRLDGARLQGNIVRVAQLRELSAALIEESQSGNESAKARSLAMLGRLELIQGRSDLAKKYYEQAVSLDSQEIQVQILFLRLEEDPSVRFACADVLLYGSSTSEPRFVLEQAIASYQLQDFRMAAALFDTAFAGLTDDFRSAYGALQEYAWKMRGSAGGEGLEPSVSDYIASSELTVRGMLMLTQAETTLLQDFTGVRLLSSQELFEEVYSAGLIPSSLAVEGGFEIVTRAQCAQYVWTLYQRTHRIAVDYTEKYRNYSPAAHMRTADAESDSVMTNEIQDTVGSQLQKGPIADVPLDSEFFNAIAGCLENNIMKLDGNGCFNPDIPVSGSEFLVWIRAAAQ